MEDSSMGDNGGATLAEISAVTAVPVVCMILGTSAVAIGGEPPERLQAQLQHFSGGLLIGAVMTDIFPILRSHLVVHPDGVEVAAWWNVLAGVVGFAAALALMYGMKSLGLEEIAADGQAKNIEDDGENSEDSDAKGSGWQLPAPLLALRTTVTAGLRRCLQRTGRAATPGSEPLLDPVSQALPPPAVGATDEHKGLQLALARLTAGAEALKDLSVADEVDREAVDEEVHGLDFLLDVARRRCQSEVEEPLDAGNAARLRLHTMILATEVTETCALDRTDLEALDAQLGSLAGRLRLIHAVAEQRGLTFRRWGSRRSDSVMSPGAMSPGWMSPIPSPSVEASPQLDATQTQAVGVVIPALPWGLVLAVLLDSMVDGMLIGLAGTVALESGWLMAMATAIEMGFLGFSFACAAAGPAKSRGGTALCVVLLGLPPVAMMLASLAASSGAARVEDKPMFVGLIAFSLAAVLFLVVEELLLEAQESEDGDDWRISVWLYFGLLLSVVLDVTV